MLKDEEIFREFFDESFLALIFAEFIEMWMILFEQDFSI